MITTVRNKTTGKVESAMEAYGCREDGHECHSCGADQEICKSHRGNFFSRLRKNCSHSPECVCAKFNNNKKLINLEEIDPDSVINGILNPKKQRGGGGGGEHPGPPRPDTERKCTVGALEEIMVLGLHNTADFRLSAEVFLHDLVINSSTICAVDVASEDLGRRVIYATPVGYQGPPYRRLVFAVFYGDEDGLKKSIFNLELASDSEYWEQFNRLYERKDGSDGNRKNYRSRYTRVLICGEWSKIPRHMWGKMCKEVYRGRWNCQAYQYAVCPYPSRQIFCHPTDLATQDGIKRPKV